MQRREVRTSNVSESLKKWVSGLVAELRDQILKNRKKRSRMTQRDWTGIAEMWKES